MTMHVAIAGWLLGEPSGANRRLLALTARIGPMLRTDERVTVLHGPSFTPPALPGVQWRAVPIPPSPTWRRAFAERRHLPAILRDLGASLLDHGFLPLPNVPTRTCLLVHDVRAADGLTHWPRFLARSALRSACARATAVVVPSGWTAARLRSLVGSDLQPIVVPNGVDMPAPAPGIAATNGTLLHTGHLEARKNLEVVIRALAAIPASLCPRLLLAGRDAGAGPRLRRLATTLAVADHVHFLGVVSEDDLATLHAQARAIVVPSVHEGFGLGVLEGLAHGRPVLASRAGALPEVLGTTGVLLPPDDPTAWAHAISALPPDDEAARAVRRARAAAFGWQPAAERLLAVWRGLHGAPD